ncbi:putative late blight resistance protein homolog r1b-12 [Phtheirospermum japonicum]|uniref:Putative late blight resistance protein homolog r1b-12 n=1 Tax=Phtheirospermum japonicum TaxID=374723 RepID=A0A830DG63_9LAMI|nr:putative late blight resistance protein homolog r1b-12 [Phtheirospermum japonicum]
MTQKMVVRVDVHDEKEKQKAMKAVSSLTGIESLAVDMKERKITVIGDVDPVQVVGKLRKYWHTELLTVGPAKEPEKKNEANKNDKKETEKIADQLIKFHNYQYYPYYTKYYPVYSAEENPNSCVIC